MLGEKPWSRWSSSSQRCLGPLFLVKAYSIQSHSIQLWASKHIVATLWGRPIYGCDGQLSTYFWPYSVYHLAWSRCDPFFFLHQFFKLVFYIVQQGSLLGPCNPLNMSFAGITLTFTPIMYKNNDFIMIPVYSTLPWSFCGWKLCYLILWTF